MGVARKTRTIRRTQLRSLVSLDANSGGIRPFELSVTLRSYNESGAAADGFAS